MHYGIITPGVTSTTGHAAWEEGAGITEITEIAQTADRLGYYHMTFSEHVAVVAGLERGDVFWDPLVTPSYLAARTSHIRFFPYVLIIGFWHPLEIAKRFGVLDLISGGRVILGIGVGNLREEFDALGAPFDDRGPRADDALRALRVTLGRSEASYQGPYYAYDDMVIKPHGSKIPLWIGGHSPRSLRRAVELADGWCPPPTFAKGPGLEGVARLLGTVELPPGFVVHTYPDERIDPIGEPDLVLTRVAEVEGVGATHMSVRPVHRSLAHYLEQIEAFAELVELAPAPAPAAAEAGV